MRHTRDCQSAGKFFPIGPRTVGNHIASIYNKLGIDDRAQAIVYAIKKGIVRL